MNTSVQSAQRLLVRVSIIFIAVIVIAGEAYAGTGKFEPDGNGGGKFNFCVSVRFNATDAQLQLIRKAFEDASQVLGLVILTSGGVFGGGRCPVSLTTADEFGSATLHLLAHSS